MTEKSHPERALREALAKLEAKWRKEGDESKGVGRRIHYQFADELAEVLALSLSSPIEPAPQGASDDKV